MTTPTDLSPAQRPVLRAVADLLDEVGSASLRQIAERAGLRSYTTARYHLMKMQHEGLVVIPPARQPRGIRLTEAGQAAAVELQTAS